MDKWLEQIIVLLTAIVGLASVAVLVSNKSQTGNVISSAGNAFSQAIGAAVAPVTGATTFTGGTGIQLRGPILNY